MLILSLISWRAKRFVFSKCNKNDMIFKIDPNFVDDVGQTLLNWASGMI
jgi:hypothetical protein